MFAVFIFVDVDYLFECLGWHSLWVSLTTLRGTLQLVATTGVSKLPSSKPSSPTPWLCSLCVRPGILQAGFARSPFCHRISCPRLTGKSLQLGAVVMGPAVLPASKLLFLTSPCLGGQACCHLGWSVVPCLLGPRTWLRAELSLAVSARLCSQLLP